MLKTQKRCFLYFTAFLVFFMLYSPATLAMNPEQTAEAAPRKFCIIRTDRVPSSAQCAQQPMPVSAHKAASKQPKPASSIVPKKSGGAGSKKVAKNAPKPSIAMKQHATAQPMPVASRQQPKSSAALPQRSSEVAIPKLIAAVEQEAARQPVATVAVPAFVPENAQPASAVAVADTRVSVMQSQPAPHDAVAVSKRLFPVMGDLPAVASGMQLAMHYQIEPKKLDSIAIDAVEEIIGYCFKDKELLVQALTTEARNPEKNYERFEFLGDKVLDAIIAQILLEKYPAAQEDSLSQARTALVSQEPMAALCLRLGLHHYIQDTQANIPISSLCDIIESLIAALYIDGGAQVAQNFVLKFFMPMLPPACPLTGLTIVQRAAKNSRQNIELIWDKKRLCGFVMCPGEEGFKLVFVKQNLDTKKDANRLILYLAVRDFIKSEFPDGANSLVSLATDADYQPLTEYIPKLDLKWSEGIQRNYRERLQTLMAKLAYMQQYTFQENEEGPRRFSCTINLFSNDLTSYGLTKAAAQENVAEIAYKRLQNLILFSKDLSIASAAYEFDMHDPVASLNAFSISQNLDMPIYTEETKENNARYAFLKAHWLMIPLKGKSASTGVLARAKVAKRAIALIKHLSTNFIEPKKLYTIDRYTYIEPTGFLNQLCLYLEMALPRVETYYCEGLVTAPLCFKTHITMAVDQLGEKLIVGEKAMSAAAAQSNAAKKTALLLVNKMLKKEIRRV